eukprot:MONOS_3604.2-p1 / transcript=MONOS_3604.2 / gene=MONOS_3604 / organism=Monocercomonoides_exilis_PA203 / gene_product=kinase-like protein , yak1p / transcript_product=yak1p / location=Mono_scaffold00086:54708-57540(-) / protein_length=657 / sequence_SO=supercontig / SO=protein_coding / is_pseudo=false
MYRNHVCFVTEMLGEDLYTILKQSKFRGLSLSLISMITAQLLDVLCLLGDLGIIHCDLKPENILLDRCLPRVKVIDFGSAVFERNVLYTYIQSRYYRAPEILCGDPYNCLIDMWSVGCIAAELFLGHPLFPGQSEHDQLCRITTMMGPIPPEMALMWKSGAFGAEAEKETARGEEQLSEKEKEERLRKERDRERRAGQAANSNQFKKNFVLDPTQPLGYRLMTWQENAEITGNTRQPKQYGYICRTLDETIENYIAKLRRDKVPLSRSMMNREPFLHFLKGLLQVDPSKRWTPIQALQHPFITHAEWTGDWKPPPDTRTSRVPLSTAVAAIQSSHYQPASTSRPYQFLASLPQSASHITSTSFPSSPSSSSSSSSSIIPSSVHHPNTSSTTTISSSSNASANPSAVSSGYSNSPLSTSINPSISSSISSSASASSSSSSSSHSLLPSSIQPPYAFQQQQLSSALLPPQHIHQSPLGALSYLPTQQIQQQQQQQQQTQTHSHTQIQSQIQTQPPSLLQQAQQSSLKPQPYTQTQTQTQTHTHPHPHPHSHPQLQTQPLTQQQPSIYPPQPHLQQFTSSLAWPALSQQTYPSQQHQQHQHPQQHPQQIQGSASLASIAAVAPCSYNVSAAAGVYMQTPPNQHSQQAQLFQYGSSAQTLK